MIEGTALLASPTRMAREARRTPAPWAQEFLDANPAEAEARYESALETAVNVRTGGTYEARSHIEHLFWAPTSVKLDQERRVYVTERNRHISITMLELMVGPRVWHWFRLMQIIAAIVTVSVWAP